jgi:hypothetical protein
MHEKSTLPTAEVTVLPFRAHIAHQGDERQPAAPIEPQVWWKALNGGTTRPRGVRGVAKQNESGDYVRH